MLNMRTKMRGIVDPMTLGLLLAVAGGAAIFQLDNAAETSRDPVAAAQMQGTVVATEDQDRGDGDLFN